MTIRHFESMYGEFPLERYEADEKGGIGYAGLYFVSEPYYPLGLWRFVATGKDSGKVSTAYFVLTP